MKRRPAWRHGGKVSRDSQSPEEPEQLNTHPLSTEMMHSNSILSHSSNDSRLKSVLKRCPQLPSSPLHKRTNTRTTTLSCRENDRELEPPPLTDASALVAWVGKLPSRRRFIGGLGTSILIALGGNLGGCTSVLLSSLDQGKGAQELGIDILIPINHQKRFRDGRNGFELTLPSNWLQDYTIAARQQRRSEQRRAIDPPSLKMRPQSYEEPLVAIGPAGSSGEINVSVIVAPIVPGFTMKGSFGSPQDGAMRFLSSIAPEGRGRTATLLRASERSILVSPTATTLDQMGTVEPVYELEYLIQGPGFYRHCLSVIATQMIPTEGNRSQLLQPQLYTFNAQCPEDQWAALEPLLTASAASFTLLPVAKARF